MDASETMLEKAKQLHHERGEITEAVELYRKILEQYPTSGAAERASAELQKIDETTDDELERAFEQDAAREAPAQSARLEEAPGSWALRGIAVIFNIFAVFNLLAGFVVALLASSETDMGISAIGALLGGAFSAVFCWAIAAAIRVLLDIAANLRRAVRLLESGRSKGDEQR